MSRLHAVKNVNATWEANCRAISQTGITQATDMDTIKVENLDSMACLKRLECECYEFQGKPQGNRAESHQHVQDYVVAGHPAVADRAVEASRRLVDDAIALEPRLAKRAQWERADDGVFADAGLVASGDDSPCYQFARRNLKETPAHGEPVVVVVSTDSSTPTSLEAIVAVVRIVQQFRPVHVYWQGAWLADDSSERGYVFTAPVITGDMDFARLAYIVADDSRDHASFAALHQLAYVRDHVFPKGLARAADRSYIAGARYVDRNGIRADAETIANTACRWLGITDVWQREYRQDQAATAALQQLPPKRVEDTRTEAQKRADARESEKSWKKYDADRHARKLAEARDRLHKVQAVE